MASGINKVILVGNLGNEPDVKYGPSGGSPVTKISIATSESWTDKNTQQKQERTEWHRVVFFGRLAEIAGEYLKKGSKVYVEGSLRTSKYTDPQGVEKYSTDIVAREMQMLDSRGGQGMGNNQGMGQNQGGYAQPQQQAQQPQQNQGYGQSQAQPSHNAGAGFGAGAVAGGMAAAPQQSAQNVQIPSSDFDDDVPF